MRRFLCYKVNLALVAIVLQIISYNKVESLKFGIIKDALKANAVFKPIVERLKKADLVGLVAPYKKFGDKFLKSLTDHTGDLLGSVKKDEEDKKPKLDFGDTVRHTGKLLHTLTDGAFSVDHKKDPNGAPMLQLMFGGRKSAAKNAASNAAAGGGGDDSDPFDIGNLFSDFVGDPQQTDSGSETDTEQPPEDATSDSATTSDSTKSKDASPDDKKHHYSLFKDTKFIVSFPIRVIHPKAPISPDYVAEKSRRSYGSYESYT